MEKAKKTDLRVVKTKAAIHRVFKEMICEMDYDKITVKELAERAMIDRKTFYLHYETIDDLLHEFQDEIVESFVSQNVSYESMDDIRRIIRYFYEFAEKMPEVNERLLCSGSYAVVGEQINARIMAHQAKRYTGAFSRNLYEDSLVFAYFAANTTILYRQWVRDGKVMPVEDLITTATRLVCNGLSSYVEKKA